MESAILPLMMVLLLNIITGCFSQQCHFSEYLVEDYCCRMCPPGKHVKTDCTLTRSTSCSTCKEETFRDKPNGFKNCFSCRQCDAASGLRVKTPCSRTSDCVCEPLEGFYCVDSSEGKCVAAKKHSSCQAGQYISKNGSLYEDTECSECSDGSFSTTGSSSWCQPHTQCHSDTPVLIRPGSSTADAQCGPADHTGVIVGVTVMVVVMVAFIAAGLHLLRKRRKNNQQSVGLWSLCFHVDAHQQDPEKFPDQQRDSVPPGSPESSSESPLNATSLELLSQEASRKAEPPQLTPLHVEKKIYPRLPRSSSRRVPRSQGDEQSSCYIDLDIDPPSDSQAQHPSCPPGL